MTEPTKYPPPAVMLDDLTRYFGSHERLQAAIENHAAERPVMLRMALVAELWAEHCTGKVT